MPSRSLPVPDGLDGTRVDAALAKLLGFSRTFAAEVAEGGGVELDGRTVGKSDKLVAGGWLQVDWEDKRGPEIVPIAVPDLGIVHDDDEIVVVDKPAGVAAHPSLGWEGPTVLGALAAGGFRIATTGAAERQGVVHRLDVGTSGLMVVAKTERAYTVLKRAFKEREVEKIYHAKIRGAVDPRHLELWRKGLRLRDGTRTKPAQVDVLEKTGRHTWLLITITEGKQRQIQRMAEALGYQVIKLARVSFGGLTFEGVRVGEWRHLKPREVDHLRGVAGLEKALPRKRRAIDTVGARK